MNKFLRDAADAIEKLAFEMKPPNEFTPRFVMIANEMRRQAINAERAALEDTK